GPQGRRPEVLVGGEHAPRRGQVEAGWLCEAHATESAAERGIFHPADAEVLTGDEVAVEAAGAAAERRILRRTLRVGDLGLEVVPSARDRRVDAAPPANRPAPLVVGMAGVHATKAISVSGKSGHAAIVGGADVMHRAHDLGRAPGLIDAEVADDVRT